MNTPQERARLNAITEQIIRCAYTVSNTLGVGFLEKVYENALAFELRAVGYEVLQQEPVKVFYKRVLVGEYFADLLVAKSIIVELKVAEKLEDVHFLQCLNYLKATGLTLGLIVNFGLPKITIRRIANDF